MTTPALTRHPSLKTGGDNITGILQFLSSY